MQNKDEVIEPGPAQDGHINPTPFKFEPRDLVSLSVSRDVKALEALGGISGLLDSLGVDTTTGSTFCGTNEDRRKVDGPRELPMRDRKPLWRSTWLALEGKVLILLVIAVVSSRALGFLQDSYQGQDARRSSVYWVEIFASTLTVFVVVIGHSINEWQMERQIHILKNKKGRRIKVTRDTVERAIGVEELVVGDIVTLEPGETVPGDGVLISGHNVKCDESGKTGEPAAVKKASYDDCIALRQLAEHQGANGLDVTNAHTNCFMISGSKVLEGYGKYVVIVVGKNSSNGGITMTLRGDPNLTPLQGRLSELKDLIFKIGGAASLALFAALLVCSLVQVNTAELAHTRENVGFTQILVVPVLLVVIAVPEGLPLAITLALAFATERMAAENLLVRVLGPCETMANTSVICTNKTGTLTQNVMSVVAGSIGAHAKFVRDHKDSGALTNTLDQDQDQPETQDFSIDQAEINTILTPQLRRLFSQSIVVNSTAFEGADSGTQKAAFVGSGTETALLQFARDLGWEDWKENRESTDIIQTIPFSTERKATGVVILLRSGHYRLFLKGASEILTKKCTRYIVVSKDPNQSRSPNSEIETRAMDGIAGEIFSKAIAFHANQMLKTIALCYRDFESWPPPGTHFRSEDQTPHDALPSSLTLMAIIAIEDPLRPGVSDAIASCKNAGVTVKMCTGDNLLTARSIAIQCGIYTEGGIVMEGPKFRALKLRERLGIIPHLQVLARASPEDKRVLVESLRSLGETVSVTGGSTNDGPALKAADVGFSLGTSGTEDAKEASDVILMDDNFTSIVRAIMWSHCINDAIRKFLQFHTSASISTIIITFVSTISSNGKSVFTTVQLLWINIVIDALAVLALATDPASRSPLDRKPDACRNQPITWDMIKMILGQSIYQVTIILIFHFCGHTILGFDHSEEFDKIVTTLAFNAFVFAQIFNSINCRRLDNKLNVFKDIFRNRYFIAITLFEIAGQVLFVSLGGTLLQVTPITTREWAISVLLGFTSIPLGLFLRCVPTSLLERAFTRTQHILSLFSKIRSGRVGASLVLRNMQLRIPGRNGAARLLLTIVIPTFVASSVGIGWSLSRFGPPDSAQNDSLKSSAALWGGGAQPRRDNIPNDPAPQRRGPKKLKRPSA